jgi:hypothetical protein
MAMAGYKAAVALKPDLIDAQMRLYDLYLARDLRADAEAAFRAAASAGARDGVTARIAEARGLEASGGFDAALAPDAVGRCGPSEEWGSPRGPR